MHLTRRFVLASRSPRRAALLRQIGINPEIMPADIPEELLEGVSPEENARRLALEKANVVALRIENGITLGADTLVVVGNEILGKPDDADHGREMLARLSGRVHTVLTAFALLDRPSGRKIVACESTLVTFRAISSEEIEEYIQGGTWSDKAGSYGIQDEYGAVFISRVEGCFYNVVGLPLSRLYVTLKGFLADISHY